MLVCLLRLTFFVVFAVVTVVLLRLLNVLNECVIAVLCWCCVLLFGGSFRLFAGVCVCCCFSAGVLLVVFLYVLYVC